MRTVSTNLYTYDELRDKARQVARDWWRNLEENDPLGAKEHQDSLAAALKFIMSYQTTQDSVASMFDAAEALRTDPSKSCPWTGYRPDELAIDAILAARNDGCDWLGQVCLAVEKALTIAWDDEMEYTMSEANVEDRITNNGYEFTVDGVFAPNA